MSDKEKCGSCEIDWDEDEDEDEEGGPFQTPAESKRSERKINQRMKKRMAGYKPGDRTKGLTGSFDYEEDDG